MLSAGVGLGGASTKFGYSETVDGVGSLVVAFDEGGQKRFTTVDYRLDATAVATWTCDPTHIASVVYSPTQTIEGTPDDKGRVSANVTLDNGPANPTTCAGIVSLRVDYSMVTLTNVTTGHSYRLADISGVSP